MAAKLAVIIALGLALTASALTQRRSGGVNEDLTSNLNSVEAEIQRKVAAAYDKGKKLGYNEGVAASREHFEADGRKLGRREGCVRSIRQQVLPFFNICRLAFILLILGTIDAFQPRFCPEGVATLSFVCLCLCLGFP